MENLDWLYAAAHVGLSNKWREMVEGEFWLLDIIEWIEALVGIRD